MSWRYDRPYPRVLEFPYPTASEDVALQKLKHSADLYTVDPDFWSDPGTPAQAIQSWDIVIAMLSALFWKQRGGARPAPVGTTQLEGVGSGVIP